MLSNSKSNSKSAFRFKTAFQGACKMQMARSRAQPIKCEYFWHLANQESVILPSLERKLRQNALCLNQSAISNFALYVVNTVITQHQIALQGLKCRAWVRNIKDSDFPNLLMQHIVLYRNIAISYLHIDIRIVGKNIVVHRCIVAAPRTNHYTSMLPLR